jgi:hypothetical protein
MLHPASNFVSNRILWDETMASVASRFLLANPEYLLCGLVGGDHVKTAHGIPARIERILTNSNFGKPIACFTETLLQQRACFP